MTGPTERDELRLVFSRPAELGGGRRDRLGDDDVLPATASQIVHDETVLDGNARLNPATSEGTWMGDHAGRPRRVRRQEPDRGVRAVERRLRHPHRLPRPALVADADEGQQPSFHH